MRKALSSIVALFALVSSGCERPAPRSEPKAAQSPAEHQLPSLNASELLDSGATLKPSPKAQALSGGRVRLVGFLADMEIPTSGAVYLVPRPVHCDEAGGGTADLPPDSVLVTLPDNLKQPTAKVEHPVEAVGVLDVGNKTDELGRVSNFRLRLELLETPTAL